MSLEMGVLPSGAELSRATTVALLSRVLGDDPDLHERVAAGEYAELDWTGERISTQWFIHPGDAGVSELVVSVWDSYPLRPAAAYRAEVTPIVEVLQELAQATGGRFIVEEGDVTSAPLDEILGMISSDEDSAALPGMVVGTITESNEDFLQRYLAAGDHRLSWLREETARTGGPERFDYSRQSLAPLWDWVISQLQPRPEDAPLERVILETGGTFHRPKNAVLPMWYGRRPSMAPSAWSDESLKLIDAIAFYALECVRRAVPELSWQVGHREAWGYHYEGLPVLAGRGFDLEPVHELIPIAGNVYRHLRPDPQNPRKPPAGEDLLDWFDTAVAERRT